jgi:hypothetical protein
MAGSMPSSNRRTCSRLIKKTAKRPAARKNWEECDDEPSPHRIAAMFVVILTRIPGMTVPTAFSTGFKVSTVGFNCDIEKCPNVARRTARALICPVGALSTQQSHIVLYNCVDRIRRDEDRKAVRDFCRRGPLMGGAGFARHVSRLAVSLRFLRAAVMASSTMRRKRALNVSCACPLRQSKILLPPPRTDRRLCRACDIWHA